MHFSITAAKGHWQLYACVIGSFICALLFNSKISVKIPENQNSCAIEKSSVNCVAWQSCFRKKCALMLVLPEESIPTLYP